MGYAPEARNKFFNKSYNRHEPHWADAYLLTKRARIALMQYPTEKAFRDAWPLRPGTHYNIGAKTIQELGQTLALAPPAPRNPPPLSLNPRLARFSDYDLRRELAARQKFGPPRNDGLIDSGSDRLSQRHGRLRGLGRRRH